MTYFEGLDFFLALAIGLIPGIVLRVMEKSVYWWVLFLSVFFAVTIFKEKPLSLIGLVVFLLGTYVLVWASYRVRAKKRLMPLFVGSAILMLVLTKVLAVWQVTFVGFLGISYVTFKAVQVVIEIFDGVIKEPVGFVDYAQFLLFFPAISSGPIDRSRRFMADIHQTMSREAYLELAGTGVFRLLLGLVYKVVLANLFYLAMAALPSQGFVWNIVQYTYSYTFYLFFDFAGYSLMAVGTSNLLGIDTPMNFNQPFRSVDIKDFWNRWHITLSTWLRDFVFSRTVMMAMRRKWFKSRVHTAMAAYMVNMVLMGFWHGLSWSYIVYGFYHGVLMAVFELYQKKSKFYKKNKQKTWYKLASWFITMQLVMIGLLIFSGKPYDYMMKLLQH